MTALVCYYIDGHLIRQRVDLDEVVIGDRIHVEDMGGGQWHVALADGACTLSVGPHGVVLVDGEVSQ